MLGKATVMAPREAIARAKEAVRTFFAEEGIDGVGLEEIRFEDGGERWLVTIGFDRARSASPSALDAFRPVWRRDYKVVTIEDASGEVVSVTNRLAD